jgi:hypothetical protein
VNENESISVIFNVDQGKIHVLEVKPIKNGYQVNAKIKSILFSHQRL